MLGAVGHGHLAILEWMVANGCRYHRSASLVAAQSEHVHIVEWMRTSDVWKAEMRRQAASREYIPGDL